jgi:hypothetical protein
MRAAAAGLWILLALFPHGSAAEIDQRVENLVFSIHVDTASDLDLSGLEQHLERARLLFHMSQASSDVTCCTKIEAADLELFGTSGDGMDIIDSESKWNQLGNRKAFVTDLVWPSPAAGRAILGGERMAVALDTPVSRLPHVIAHERGHNAGLNHRDDDPCNLMHSSGDHAGCLQVSECQALRALGYNDGTCTCMGPSIGDPPLSDETVCSAEGETGYCKAGLCAEGVVFRHQKISHTQGNFTGNGAFNLALAALGDLNGDGVGDLAARGPTGPGAGPGQREQGIWILFLNGDGTVKSHQPISPTEGGFDPTLGVIGHTVTSLGDLDGDGIADIATGQNNDDDGGIDRGSAWVLFLNADGTVKSQQRISSTHGGFTGPLSDGDEFAIEVAFLRDFNADGVPDMAAGARSDDDGGTDRGAVWVLFLDTDGTVKSHQKISDTEGGFTGILHDFDLFGESVASLGDLDGDGVGDMAVSAVFDDDGGTNRGAVWVLFLNSDGTVKSHQKISQAQGGFTGQLTDFDGFGASLSFAGDLNGDGVGDLVVGTGGDDDGGANRGAVWILHLNSDGTVKSHEKISSTRGGFTGTLDDDDRFGTSVASLGRLTDTGVGAVAVNAWHDVDDDAAIGVGAVWILFIPEPATTLQCLSAIAVVVLLGRMRHRERAGTCVCPERASTDDSRRR